MTVAVTEIPGGEPEPPVVSVALAFADGVVTGTGTTVSTAHVYVGVLESNTLGVTA